MSHRCRALGACAAVLSCAPRTGQLTVPAALAAEVSMEMVIPDRGPSWAMVRGDSAPGRLTIAGELLAPTACGHLDAVTKVPGPGAVDLRLIRHPPGPDSVCLDVSATYRFVAVVHPLLPGPYRLRAQYIYLRHDGSTQLDTLVADTSVRVP